MTLVGAVDFLFFHGDLNGGLLIEAGELGEDWFEFRSFLLMTGGPLVVLYSIIFC